MEKLEQSCYIISLENKHCVKTVQIRENTDKKKLGI